MPKKFAVFLITAQAVLTLLYWLLYKLAVFFFPALMAHSIVLWTTLSLSVSFLGFSLLTHYIKNLLIDIGYILAAILLALCMYGLLFMFVALLIYLVLPVNRPLFGLLGAGTACVLIVYGLINARIIRTVNLKISLPNLPDFWKGKTAVVATDLHLGRVLRSGFAKKIVRRINAEKPDLVFFPGDFYDGVPADFQDLANAFKNLKAPLGAYFCSGNHELYAGYEVCEQAIKNVGIKILENEKIELQGLQIIGLAYKGIETSYEGETDAGLKLRLEKIGVDKTRPSVLLKHLPSRLKIAEQSGINLELCGHTHHGQIWPGRYITKKLFKGFDYGYKRLGNLQVYVSSGVGTWGPPLKIFTKAEIIKISLN